MIEIYAAIVGASIGIAGLSASSFNKRNSESREAVVRLTMAVESIAGKLEELTQDIRTDRKEIHTRLNEQGNRITILEGRKR